MLLQFVSIFVGTIRLLDDDLLIKWQLFLHTLDHQIINQLIHSELQNYQLKNCNTSVSHKKYIV